MVATDTIQLTDEQEAAVEYCTRGDKEVVRMGGLAGTGKSVCVEEMRRRLPGYGVCAYTGKAANVLRRKGVHDASTIHSIIYKPHDEGGGQVSWELRQPHELFLDGFIVDEASMVSEDIHRDLLTFGVPLVYVGDHGQLEPVNAGSSVEPFCLMRDPDVALETIHRNAGEIARFAGWLRAGNDAADWHEGGGQVLVITGEELRTSGMERADQIVCAFNKTRVALNNSIRECLGLPRMKPVEGDRIICLQNDREQRLFNGMQGKVTKIDYGTKRLWFEDEDGTEYQAIRFNPMAFGEEKTPKRVPGQVPFDWSYCVTCHKMQGSEADDVVVLEQRCDRLWSHQRWAYTAASRAKRRLTWVLPPPPPE